MLLLICIQNIISYFQAIMIEKLNCRLKFVSFLIICCFILYLFYIFVKQFQICYDKCYDFDTWLFDTYIYFRLLKKISPIENFEYPNIKSCARPVNIDVEIPALFIAS